MEINETEIGVAISGQSGEDVKIKKTSRWESVPVWIFCTLAFLIPVFVLPIAGAPFVLGKALLLYAGISLSALFWFFSRLKRGEIRFPKSWLLLVGAALAAAWFVSSIFSINSSLSFIGRGHESDTFLFFLFLSAGLFLVSDFFQTEKRVLMFYFSLFISGLAAFLFQFFHTIFSIDIVPFEIFQYPTSNLFGAWTDFGIFFGLIALVSIVFLGLFKFKIYLRAALYAAIVFSIAAMLAVNFLHMWIIFGFSVLVFLVYLLSRKYFAPGGYVPSSDFKMMFLPLVVILATLFFILASGTTGAITDYLNTSTIEVRPSLDSTINIVKQAFKINPLLGTGPNTFLYDWFKFKSPSVNATMFWNARFTSGIGYFLSAFATAGVIGGLALVLFFVLLLCYGVKALSYDGENNLANALLVASFLGALYLWSFTIFYSPGFAIFAFAFLFTGLLVGVLVLTGKLKMAQVSFLRNPKIGFISVLILVVFMISSISSFYLVFQKFLGAYHYGSAIKIFNSEGDFEKTERMLTNAIIADEQDEYLRTLSEFYLLKLQRVLYDTSLNQEQAKAQFQDGLGKAIQNAQRATSANSMEPLNWMQLGRVYEFVVPLNIAGADNMAISSYEQAIQNSPLDPSPLLALARVRVQTKKIQEAKDYLQSALKIKSDFAPALFMLSQIEAQQGNLKEAIAKTEQTAVLAPNDLGVLFQLGLLYYQAENIDGARLAFERCVFLDEHYANARYFLGLIYDKKGLNDEAIKQFENIEKTNPDNQEVKTILSNLRSGKSALENISPPAKSPEDREKPPISEKTESELNKR